MKVCEKGHVVSQRIMNIMRTITGLFYINSMSTENFLKSSYNLCIPCIYIHYNHTLVCNMCYIEIKTKEVFTCLQLSLH